MGLRLCEETLTKRALKCANAFPVLSVANSIPHIGLLKVKKTIACVHASLHEN